jgi:quinoprotein glucose dehydrogenase
MPQLNTQSLTEAQMWGMTPIDQLQCRILFRSLRYDGQFTPLSTRGSIYDPGPAGYMDWGGVSVDEGRRVMLVNSIRMPFVMTAIPRTKANAMGISSVPGPNSKETDGYSEMGGTPFAVGTRPFLSFTHIPCVQPPWGYIQAIDLDTRQTVWKRPLGTGRDSGPFGLKFGPPVELGVFSQGGSLATISGLTFIGSTVDRYLRAIDSRTGEELWRGRLPAGGQANPITYRDPTTGKQYVMIAAGGHSSLETKRGDYVVAYALP